VKIAIQPYTPGLTVEDPVVQQFLQRHHGGPVVDATTGSVVGWGGLLGFACCVLRVEC
jgi:hypothetical protein